MVLRRQIPRFLIVGATTVLIDLTIYIALLKMALPPSPAKAASFVVGAVFAYVTNRIYTFKSAHNWLTFIRFWIVYCFGLALNVAINSVIVEFTDKSSLAIMMGFFVATGVSATSSFIGMRYFVFKPEQRYS